jgi:cytochrome c5
MGRFVLSVTAAAMVMLCVVAASGQGQQPARDGEQIMNATCGSCHDTTPILTAARSEQEWKDTIEQMIARGASVSDADRPLLIAYLVKAHGPMPDGPGKDIVLNTCTICHDLSRIKSVRHTKEEWQETLIAMLNEGAPLSDENFPVVLNYLAKNFGVN